MAGGPVYRRTGGPVGLLFLSSLATTAMGQQVDRSVRPVTQAPPAFKFPAIHTHTLANGLRLLVVEDHSVPVVAVRAVVGADSLRDSVGKEGLYAVTLGALREGSTNRSADDLADAAAAIGTNVTPTGFTTISSAFEPALSIMSKMLTAPAFDSAAIERRKAIHAAAARRIAQAPVTIPRHLFYRSIYSANDPFVRSLLPTEASIVSITRSDVKHFYDTFFGPRSTTLTIAGDVSDSAAVAIVTRAFGGWQARGEAPHPDSDVVTTAKNETRVYLRDVPNAGTLAYLYVGGLGPSRNSSDAIATEAFAAVASTRLQETLREKRSFIYSSTTGLTWRHAAGEGAFVGSAVVNAEKADSALAEWLTILRELRTTRPPTADELAAVRRNRLASLPARIDGPDSVAARLVEIARDGLPHDYFDRYASRMSALTVADASAAGARCVDLDHLAIVVTGDRRVLEPVLRAANLAPVFVVTAPPRSTP
jgi:zinc protease